MLKSINLAILLIIVTVGFTACGGETASNEIVPGVPGNWETTETDLTRDFGELGDFKSSKIDSNRTIITFSLDQPFPDTKLGYNFEKGVLSSISVHQYLKAYTQVEYEALLQETTEWLKNAMHKPRIFYPDKKADALQSEFSKENIGFGMTDDSNYALITFAWRKDNTIYHSINLFNPKHPDIKPYFKDYMSGALTSGRLVED